MIHLLTALLLYIMKICGLHNFHSKCDTSLGGFTIVLGGWWHFFGEYLLLPFELKPTHETCFMQDHARQGDKKIGWVRESQPPVQPVSFSEMLLVVWSPRSFRKCMVWRISSPALPKRRICSPKLAPLQPLHVKPMSRDPGGWKWLVWPKNGMWLWCWEFMIGVLARLVLIPSFIGPFLVWEISRFSTRQLPLALMVLCLQCITSITWLTRWALPRASASGVMESCTIPVHWESTMTMLRQLGLFQFLRFASAAS